MKTNFFLVGLMVMAFLPFRTRADEPQPASEKPAAPAAATATPGAAEKRDTTTKTYQGDALKLKEQMIGLFQASERVNSATEKAKSRDLIEGSVDWDRIAKTCLGGAWKKQSAQNREQFQKLLKEVILKTAFSRMDTFWDGTTYKFDKIDVKGKDSKVRVKFMLKEEAYVLDYFMDKKGERWMMYDIIVDDLRYSEVINEKVTTFLRDGKFAGLLENLRKRLEELEKDEKDNKKS